MSPSLGTWADRDCGSVPRIAILVEDNKTFLLPAVERAVRRLDGSRFRVTHLGIVPPKLGRFLGWRLGLWHLRVLGWWNTALLGLFALLEAGRRVRAHFGAERLSLSWPGLAKKSGLEQCRFLRCPNDPAAIEFLHASECDILIVMLPYILGLEALKAPKVGAINKHAAMLPGCRGLFPYRWSTLLGRPLGITFHKVVAKIDAGPVLLRRPVAVDRQPRSMLEFYLWVYREFPELAVEAARRLHCGIEEPCAQTSSGDYFGLPTRADYVPFRSAGGARVVNSGPPVLGGLELVKHLEADLA